MFNYVRNDQATKKSVQNPSTEPINMQPMTPIEMQVNMPIEQQPVPSTMEMPTMMEMQPTITCMYPNMPCMGGNMGMQSMPSMPCMHCNMGMQPVPSTPSMGCNMGMQPVPSTPSMGGNITYSNPSCDMSKAHDDMEVAYLKKMYPPLCQKIQKYIESELNQYDHDLSPIYEMYPASETIDHMANCIYTDMKADLGSMINEYEGGTNTRAPIGGSFYTLVYALLLNELYRKRMRRRLYPTYPSPFGIY